MPLNLLYLGASLTLWTLSSGLLFTTTLKCSFLGVTLQKRRLIIYHRIQTDRIGVKVLTFYLNWNMAKLSQMILSHLSCIIMERYCVFGPGWSLRGIQSLSRKAQISNVTILAGVWKSRSDIVKLKQVDKTFQPQAEQRAKSLEQYRQWVKACHRFKNWNVI